MPNFEQLLSFINDAVWSIDVETDTYLYVNQRLADIAEISLAELKGSPAVWMDLIHPLDKERVRKQIIYQGKRNTFKIEYRIVTPSAVKWVVDKRQLFAGDNNCQVLTGVITDITEIKLTHLKLNESKKTYRYLFKNNPNPLWIYERETLKFMAVNDAAIEKYGYSEKEFLSLTTADIRPAQDLPRMREGLKNIENWYKGTSVWRHMKKDGSIIWMSILVYGIVYKGVPAEIVLAVDITEELNIKQDILNKNARLMEIAALASHDIRGPLMSILGLTNIFNQDQPDDPFNLEVLANLQRAVHQLDDVVHRIVDKSFKMETEEKSFIDAFQQNR